MSLGLNSPSFLGRLGSDLEQAIYYLSFFPLHFSHSYEYGQKNLLDFLKL